MVKNPPAMGGDLGSIPGLGRSFGEGNGNSLQAPPSMGFSRQEYWSEVAFPSPEYAIEVRKSGIQSHKYFKINNNNNKQYRINCKFFSIRKIIKVT